MTLLWLAIRRIATLDSRRRPTLARAPQQPVELVGAQAQAGGFAEGTGGVGRGHLEHPLDAAVDVAGCQHPDSAERGRSNAAAPLFMIAGPRRSTAGDADARP